MVPSQRRKVVDTLSTVKVFLKRSAIIGLLAALCFGLSAPARASVIYNVDIVDFLTGSGVTLSGTITTDGATGFLQPSDITSFHLVTSGLASLAVDSANTGFICPLTGCELQVIGNQLIAGVQGLTTLSEIDFGRTANTPFANNNSIRFVSDPTLENSQVIVFNASGVPYVVANDNGLTPIVVGTAVNTVPLPGAVHLFLSGLFGLFGAARRRTI